MTDLSRMEGTPWHVERYTRKEDDERRHRSRCIYYSGKSSVQCQIYKGSCRGSAHCYHYCERIENEEPKENLVQAPRKEKVLPFDGVKELPLDLISQSGKGERNSNETKLRKIIKDYKLNGAFDKPIEVKCREGNYIVVERQSYYMAARIMNLSTIPAEMSDYNSYKRNAFRQIGTKVKLKKSQEMGEVVNFSIKTTSIKLESGKIQKYDIHQAIKTGSIQIL